jgi:outer membrane protein TolC/ABC-type uncharacterized transport system substrate-binding protein
VKKSGRAEEPKKQKKRNVLIDPHVCNIERQFQITSFSALQLFRSSALQSFQGGDMKVNRQPKFSIFICIICIVCGSLLCHGQAKKKLTIGAVLDGQWYKNSQVLKTFKKEIFDLLSGEYDVIFTGATTITGNWTLPSVKNGLDKLLKDPKIDIVIAMGMIVSNEACRRSNLEKPVIAPFIQDPFLQHLPRKGKGSGVKNLNYLISIAGLNETMKYFKKLAPFDTAVLLSAAYIPHCFPEFMKRAPNVPKEIGVNLESIWVGDSADDVIAKLKPGMQAIYITPLIHLSRSQVKKIITAINKLQIPTFSHMGDTDVEDGVLAALHKKIDFNRLARRVALNIQSILMGEDAAALPVDFKAKSRLIINMDTARQIGVFPSWDVMTEAELLNEEPPPGKKLTLMNAVNRAIKANLELSAEQIEFRLGKQDIRLARSKLLPQIGLSALAVKIDKDRAQSSFGLSAENTLSGSASLSQVIFSEPMFANLSIQKHIQTSRRADLDRVTLDIALAAALAYVDVLRAKALVRVQKNNLDTTRSNLELAKVRRSLGVSSPSEVYRWEAQYATSQKALLDARNHRDIAEINLNRILHHPQQEHFDITDAGLDSPFLKTRDTRFFSYINNPWVAQWFGEFWVEKGLKNAPELARMDAAIAAKKRQLNMKKRNFYMPSLWLQAGVTNYFSKTGAGGLSFPNEFASLFPPPPNDTDFNIALQLSFPLFSGGGKSAEHKKVKMELQKLETDRRMLAEILEQHIRTRANFAWTANAKIPLSGKAAQAAAKTLELVTDAYSRGAVSILDLIDAQDAGLAADLAAANAIYDFLANMFRAQRSVNKLDFLAQTDSQMLTWDEFEAFLLEKGITLKKKKTAKGK